MSTKLPFVNHQYNAAGSVRYDAPSAAAQKPANTAFVLGLWVRAPDAPFVQRRPHVFLGRQNTGTGGNDAYLRFTSNSATDIAAKVNSGGQQRFAASVALGGSAYGKALLVMIVCNAAQSHLVVCEPGGSPIVATDATNGLYAVAMTSTPFMHRIGSGPNSGFYGDIEEYFYIRGAFPEVGNVPDPALVQAIADGSQDLDTLDALLTGGAKQCRYRMRDEFDLADAWGLQSPLTLVLGNPATGHLMRASGPLRPLPLRPARTRMCLSQASFPTPGSAAGATATIRTEGGAFVGITPAAIQARLVKEDGATLVNWTTVDAAPAAGTWAAGQLAVVPLTAGFLRLDFRAVDGGGSQIGDHVASHGLRGTAAAVWLSQGQSQLMHLWGTDPLALPDGINLAVTQQVGSGAIAPGSSLEYILSSGCPNNIVVGMGMRQAAIEVNTLYPGVPIHLLTVGESGTMITEFITGGPYEQRWAALAAHLGVVQDMSLLLYGHSGGSSADAAGYQAQMDQLVTLAEAGLGTFGTVIACPTARYSLIGTGGSWPAVERNRAGARLWVDAHPGKGYWGGSWSVVATSETGTADPHPGDTAAGEGRSGALQAWAALMAARAVVDEPVGLVSATAAGTSVKLKFGPVN